MAIVLFKLYQPFILLLPELVVWFEAHVIFPSESDFVQSSLSIKTKCVLLMPPPLRSNPNPKRLVLMVPVWRHAMAHISFKLDQLFVLLVPELVVWFEATTASFPSEPDFVQESLSIRSNFVIDIMTLSLRTNPLPKSLVLLVPKWHHTMAIFSFKLHQLFTLLVPELVVGFQATTASFPSEPDFVQESLSIESKFVIVINAPLRSNPLP
jgi:hypothetical protein